METIRKFERVFEIIDQNQRSAARLIPILQAVQAEYRYLPEEISDLCSDITRHIAGEGLRGGNFLFPVYLKAKGQISYPRLQRNGVPRKRVYGPLRGRS